MVFQEYRVGLVFDYARYAEFSVSVFLVLVVSQRGHDHTSSAVDDPGHQASLVMIVCGIGKVLISSQGKVIAVVQKIFSGDGDVAVGYAQ